MALTKQRVQIVTVDPESRRIEALTKDGAIIQIAVFEIPTQFRWPVEGEFWTVYREGLYWHLGSAFEVDEDFKVEDMEPGETKIGSDKIRTKSGDRVVAIEGEDEDRPDDTVPTWDATDEKWVPTPGTSVGIPDKNLVWPQGVASKWWGTPIDTAGATVKHNLGKRPAVTVVDSSGREIEVDVQHINNNEVKINLDQQISGFAYFN